MFRSYKFKLYPTNPANTSTMCSNCGFMVEKDLSEKWYSCKECGLELDRDHNASINILGKALPEEAEKILLGLKSKQNGMIAHPISKDKIIDLHFLVQI